jgi:hypothetical protein
MSSITIRTRIGKDVALSFSSNGVIRITGDFNSTSSITDSKEIDGTVIEDAPTNCAGGGAVAAIGVGPDGEPGVGKKKKKKTVSDSIVFSMLKRKISS